MHKWTSNNGDLDGNVFNQQLDGSTPILALYSSQSQRDFPSLSILFLAINPISALDPFPSPLSQLCSCQLLYSCKVMSLKQG